MSSVLDASALLAALKGEPGSDVVAAAIASGADICGVNLGEVVSKLCDGGMDGEAIRSTIALLGLNVIDFDESLAYAAGLLRPRTRQAGLSLGDRACLALAQRLGTEALTTDKRWASLNLGIGVRIIR